MKFPKPEDFNVVYDALTNSFVDSQTGEYSRNVAKFNSARRRFNERKINTNNGGRAFQLEMRAH